MKTNKTIACPMCGRTVNVRVNKFGDETYARHKMDTQANLTRRIFTGIDNDRN